MTDFLEARDVSVRVRGRELLTGVSLGVRPGEVLGLIGPNGAGKSTLLAALAGDCSPDGGEVLLAGKPYASYSPREAARLRAVMTQDTTVSFAHLVRDVVALGRTSWPRDPRRDGEIIDYALDVVRLHDVQEREVTTLSGGERARVALARVIAQQARCLLLDEPTAAMDVGYQEHTLHLARHLAATGVAVIVVLHDLGAASRFCDRVALLRGGRLMAVGAPGQVCTAERLSEVYQWPVAVDAAAGAGLWIRPAPAARVEFPPVPAR
ncbi:heme ABC transporter ATP-binding protein [Corynebacterium sp. zg-331]|uniref:heme ABC transporter ATP-binding protein n=1 Tax=unclassified Corynebacterium TaxID=2624378 RepID=UPI00128E716A|nr:MULTISPECIES: heme ABC transporter ATP-binding protein [unclassified Corynebacterium]MBC3185657.1 heme ABC transporter ATP-binding protein [Corynebacterium sp. zg-331]MPV52151.1 heme ABC transporter ATP-binding protein [Corynebacterium sp. zg331]